MELVLTIIAGVGILIFALSYLSYLFKGFRHHFVTGLIATLPVLNVVTLPALWHKAGKTFIMGFLGLVIFATSWFLGADKGIKNLVASSTGNTEKIIASTYSPKTEMAIPLSLPPSLSSDVKSNMTKENNNRINLEPKKGVHRSFIDESKLQKLPNKALYKLGFDAISIDSITTLTNRIVKIRLTNGQVHEGRIINVNSNTVLLKMSQSEQEYPISNIVKLQLMVKR